MTVATGPEALTDNPFGPARIIVDEVEALRIADEVAAWLVPGARDRDLGGEVPWQALQYLSASGLAAIRLPARLGGADPSLAQLYYVDLIKGQFIGEMPAPEAAFFAAEALAGARWGNATQLVPEGGHYLLNGEKHFCAGALTSHWTLVPARHADGAYAAAILPAGITGMEFGGDWDVVGQRSTFSVSVRFRDVVVPAAWVDDGSFTPDPLRGCGAVCAEPAGTCGVAGRHRRWRARSGSGCGAGGQPGRRDRRGPGRR
ncbi:acyl-CoA dehydrogenase family protein [Rhodobacter sp. 24-YEA-8]|uniref:acyl-CoA dehydrogenase family protein n=1 Tax=Rhodobacter sp. 24-YEA-8 TaxID=1884310 RepID=UPI000B8A58A7|nr:acyl-CoA dehydrogenase family protein [Rhodobacter sp. 24-YEA-8]